MFQKLGFPIAILLGSLVLPLGARAETAQSGNQTAVVSGNNNQVTQIINQTILNRPGRGNFNRFQDKDKKNRDDLQSERNGNRYGRESGRSRDRDKHDREE